MPEKTKPEEDAESLKPENHETCIAPAREAEADSTWAQDQRERDYYYDDSHGYKIYVPEEDEDE